MWNAGELVTSSGLHDRQRRLYIYGSPHALLCGGTAVMVIADKSPWKASEA